MAAGLARVYWLAPSPTVSAAAQLSAALAACETDLRVVAAAQPDVPGDNRSWLLDPAGELGRAVGATGPLAIVVDASGRLAALLPSPSPDGVVALATHLYMASTPAVVRAQAPVLLLDRLLEPALCQALIGHWRRGDKLADGVASASGASVADTEMKRRQDVPLDDARLFVQLCVTAWYVVWCRRSSKHSRPALCRSRRRASVAMTQVPAVGSADIVTTRPNTRRTGSSR